MKKLSNLILAGLIVASTGCSVNSIPFAYKIDIAQGNLLEEDSVSELKTGMNRQEVIELLGSPMLVDPFHNDRWDYYYSMKPGHGELVTNHIVVLFDNNRVSEIIPKG